MNNYEFSDNYFGSKYNHWKFEDFCNFSAANMKGKKRGFLEYLNDSKIYENFNDRLLGKLLEYYCNLDNILIRLQKGYYDPMFMRYAYYSHFFYFEDMFNITLQNWDDMFSLACEEYYNTWHYNFNETYGTSYVAYFDLYFSRTLYNQLAVFDKVINKIKNFSESKQKGLAKSIEMYRFSWLISDKSCFKASLYHNFEYPSESYLEELAYQSFSPSDLTIF